MNRATNKKTASAPHTSKTQSLNISYLEITKDPIETGIEQGYTDLPEHIKEEVNELYAITTENPEEAIPKLEKLLETYPNAPQVSNYLCAAYAQVGRTEELNALIQACYRRNPKYLFARANYAGYCLREGKPEAVPEIFEHTFDLKALYPDRKQFHISEAVAFFGVLGLYFNQINEDTMARNAYKIILGLDPHAPMTQQLMLEIMGRSFGKLIDKMGPPPSKPRKKPSSSKRKKP